MLLPSGLHEASSTFIEGSANMVERNQWDLFGEKKIPRAFQRGIKKHSVKNWNHNNFCEP